MIVGVQCVLLVGVRCVVAVVCCLLCVACCLSLLGRRLLFVVSWLLFGACCVLLFVVLRVACSLSVAVGLFLCLALGCDVRCVVAICVLRVDLRCLLSVACYVSRDVFCLHLVDEWWLVCVDWVRCLLFVGVFGCCVFDFVWCVLLCM